MSLVRLVWLVALLMGVMFIPGAAAEPTETESTSACVETSHNYVGARPGQCLAVAQQIVHDVTGSACREE